MCDVLAGVPAFDYGVGNCCVGVLTSLHVRIMLA